MYVHPTNTSGVHTPYQMSGVYLLSVCRVYIHPTNMLSVSAAASQYVECTYTLPECKCDLSIICWVCMHRIKLRIRRVNTQGVHTPYQCVGCTYTLSICRAPSASQYPGCLYTLSRCRVLYLHPTHFCCMYVHPINVSGACMQTPP